MGSTSDRIPRAGRDGIAAFVVFDVIDDGLDWLAREPAVADALRQHGRALVTPAEFQNETIPHVALLVGALRAAAVDPREDFLVGAAGERALAHLGISDAEKAAAAAIEDH